MDILRPGGTRWRISRRRFTSDGDSVPWMSDLGGRGTPPAASDLGRRPLVVSCDDVVMHVEPAPGRRDVATRIRQLSDALHDLPWAAGTVDDPDHTPYHPGAGPGTTGGWGAPGQGGPPTGGWYAP